MESTNLGMFKGSMAVCGTVTDASVTGNENTPSCLLNCPDLSSLAIVGNPTVNPKTAAPPTIAPLLKNLRLESWLSFFSDISKKTPDKKDLKKVFTGLLQSE
jgi:hypothetical protein